MRVERRPKSGKRFDDRAEHGIARRPGSEGVEVERQAEEMTDLDRRLLAPWLDSDTAAVRGDPHLAPGDDSMESAVVQDRRPSEPKSRNREVESGEVVRLGNSSEHADR